MWKVKLPAAAGHDLNVVSDFLGLQKCTLYDRDTP